MHVIIGLAIGAIFILVASGLSMIFGLMDVVNFGHGVFYMLGAYALFQVNMMVGNFWIALVISVPLVAGLGALTEMGLLRPLYKTGNVLYPLLLTFGLAVAVPAIVKIFYGLMAMPVNYPSSLSGSFMAAGLIIPKYRIFVIVITAVAMGTLLLFLKKSNLGMILRASTTEKLMVNALGVNVLRVLTLGFAIGIGLAALGGAVAAPMVAVEPDMGLNMLLESFVVTVVGGLGSLGGAIVGGLIIGQVVSFTSLFAGAWADVVIYIVMAVILLARPRGLMGEEGRE